MLRGDANAANGMALHPDGRLLVCEQGTRLAPARISLVDRATGAAETVVDGWGGLPLNSPNDVVVGSDGAVWFTDPSYGFLQGFRPAPRSATSSTATTRARARPPSWPRGSTSPTGWPSRPTSASSTSATPAKEPRTRDRGVRRRRRARAHRAPALRRHRSGLPRRGQGRRRRARLLGRAGRRAGLRPRRPARRRDRRARRREPRLRRAGRIFITADTAVWAAATPDPRKER